MADTSTHTTGRCGNARHRRRILGNVLRIALPLMISGSLVWWMLSKVDVRSVADTVRDGCDLRWLALTMVVVVFSHVIRGIRWGIQLRAAGVRRLSVMTESCSIFGAYALNLVVPYLGEAWRCVYISRIGPARITTVVGTDLGDRISDAVVVVLLVVLAVFVAHPAMVRFMDHYSVGRDLQHMVENVWMWIWTGVILVAFAALVYFGRSLTWVRKMMLGMKRIWNGFVVLFHMKGIGMYLLLTAGIWVCYFMETYICFHAFPFTLRLIEDAGTAYGLIPGLVVFVFGSCSIAIPSSGGLGTWNIAVMFALTLYGVSDTDAAAYSLTVWSCETLTLIALGIFTAVYVSAQRCRYNRRDHAGAASASA